MSAPQRIQRKRTKGWRMPENAIYVGRPTKWGNPFSVDEYGLELSLRIYRDIIRGLWSPTPLSHLSGGDFHKAYDGYDTWRQRFHGHPIEAVWSELPGKDLACWCPLDLPCHADVLLELANREVGR